jgi:hypothetical protein
MRALQARDHRINELETEIAGLKSRAATNVTQRNNNSNNVLSFASVLRDSGNQKVSEALAVISSTMNREVLAKKRIEKNIIISGLPSSTNALEEESQISNVLKEVGVSLDKVKSHRRLLHSSTSISASTRPAAVIVEFKELADKLRAVRDAKKLRESISFRGIYINEDKTKDQRISEAAFRKERNERNRELEHHDSDGRPFGLENGTKFVWAASSTGVRKVFIK